MKLTDPTRKNESVEDRSDVEKLTRWSRRALAGFWTSAVITWLWVMPGIPFGLSRADYTEGVLTIVLFNAVAFATGATALYLRSRASGSGLTWRRLALHDPLTGLANRTLLEQRWKEIQASQPTNGAQLGLLFVDLDHFKEVNDQHGHIVGDKILIALADRLGRGVGASAMIARYGGDEFVALLEIKKDKSQAKAVAERILEEVREPFRTEGLEIIISASIGVAMSKDRDGSLEDLVEAADRAAYQAKMLGKGRYVVSASGDASSEAA